METRVFTCNQEGWPYTEVQDDIDKAKKQLSEKKPSKKSWSCGNIKQIKVGDRAYFYRVGSEPRGFFACGRVITTEIQHQLRLTCPYSENLSEAYTDALGDLRISYELYSVVDYDKTLSGELIRTKSYNFLFRQSGARFKKEYVGVLDEYWDKHVIKMTKQGYGAYIPTPIT